MRVLRAAHKANFSYCEQYQEPRCCEATPCNAEAYWKHARQHGRNHVRLVKSHDFDLTDLPYPTPRGVIRLVQVREALPTLASWMEFEHLRFNRELLQAHGISHSRNYLLHETGASIETSWQLIDRCG